MSTKSEIKALDTLQNSRGWAILKERMEREVVDAAMQLGSHKAMSNDEIHFRRGSIWAAKQLLDLPERLIALLQSSAPLAPLAGDKLDDTVVAPPLPTADTPAKAGNGELTNG